METAWTILTVLALIATGFVLGVVTVALITRRHLP